MRIDVKHTFAAPVEVVFPYLADPARWSEYIPGVEERRQLTPGTAGPGTTWSSVDKLGPFRIHFTDELTALEPHRRIVFRQSAPWNSWEESVCEPQGDRTLVTVHFEAQPSGWLRLLDLMPDSMAARASYGQDFQRLDRLLAKTG
jgi:uncharacterized protein YndB with AHSA1/START domain